MKIKIGGIILAMVMLMSLSIGTTVAAEKGPINFVILTDLTGPAHAQVASQGWAAEDYFKWLDKQGGIDGHPVTIEVVDTRYQLPLIRTAYTRYKNKKHTTISFDAISGGIEAMRKQFPVDQIPVQMLTGHGPAVYPSSWVFASIPPYDDTLCAYANWIKANWDKERKPRLALLLGDYASGRSPEAAKWYCEKMGIDIVSVEYVPLMPMNTTDLLTRMISKEPDFVFDTLMPDQVKVVLQDRFKLGIKIPQINFVFNSYLIKKSGSLESYAGYMGFQHASSWWETSVPGVKFSYELYKHRGPVPTATYIAAVGGHMVWVEAVKNALETVGYDNLDGQAIYDGYMKIKNFKAMGIFNEISYHPDDLRGAKWLKITKFEDDGSISNVTDWFEAPHNLKLKDKAGK